MSQPRASGKFSTEPLENRFWRKVVKTDDCWLWIGGKGERGYGRIWKDGKIVPAAHIAWELTYGQIPPDNEVLHKCDNPPCVRPDHLFLGDQAANQTDCIRKGRHPSTKLSLEKAAEIRALYATGQWSYWQLARRFNVWHSAIADIVTGKSWKLDALAHPDVQEQLRDLTHSPDAGS